MFSGTFRTRACFDKQYEKYYYRLVSVLGPQDFLVENLITTEYVRFESIESRTCAA